MVPCNVHPSGSARGTSTDTSECPQVAQEVEGEVCRGAGFFSGHGVQCHERESHGVRGYSSTGCTISGPLFFGEPTALVTG